MMFISRRLLNDGSKLVDSGTIMAGMVAPLSSLVMVGTSVQTRMAWEERLALVLAILDPAREVVDEGTVEAEVELPKSNPRLQGHI